MDERIALKELKALFARRSDLNPEQGTIWISQVAALIEPFDDIRSDIVRDLGAKLALGLSEYTVRPIWGRLQQTIQDVIANFERGLYAHRTQDQTMVSPLPQLKVVADAAREKIATRVAAGETLAAALRAINSDRGVEQGERDLEAWHSFNTSLLISLFVGVRFVQAYEESEVGPTGIVEIYNIAWKVQSLLRSVEDRLAALRSISDQVQLCQEPAPNVLAMQETPVARVLRICTRFHRFVTELSRRHASRPSFKIDDEYDVQDLLRSLLRIDFDDIRPEEWTPNYAGKSSRMDFLLKRERIVIETKRTRATLGAQGVADQLIVDIDRYKEHPQCSTLVCFVYDPERHIHNPAELEGDLSGQREEIEVAVVVSPKDAG